MPWLRCPKCTFSFETDERAEQVCPACGHRDQVAPSEETEGGTALHPLPDGVVGKARRSWAFVGLSIVTLLVYPMAWYGKAFRELDEQHGRRHRRPWWLAWVFFAALFWAGVLLAAGVDLAPQMDVELDWLLVGAILALPGALALTFFLTYVWVEMRRVRKYRRAHRLGASVGPVGATVWLMFGGLAVAGGGAFLGLAIANDLDFAAMADWDTEAPWEHGPVLGLAALGLVVGFLPGTLRINRSVKQLWREIHLEQDVPAPEWLAKPEDLAEKEEPLFPPKLT